MSATLTFTDEVRYPDAEAGIIIPVTLAYKGESMEATAKVDPGAAVCLFSHEIGSQLSVPIEDGLPIRLSSFIGGTLEAFGHEVTLVVGDLTMHTLVYFAKYPGLPNNFLGRRGWLRNLKLGLIDYDNLLYLNAYD